MTRIIPLFIAMLLLPVPLMAAGQLENMNGRGPAAAHEGLRHDFTVFVKSYAHPIKGVEPTGKCDDLAFLDNFTDGAKIVALGESRHGSHEFMQLRRRIIECLVKRDGFTNVLLEAGLPYTVKLNVYLHGGKGSPEKLVEGMTYWSLYQDKEFLGLLNWLKDYNANASHHRKLNLLGIDMQDPRAGTRDTLAYLRKVDPAFSSSLGAEKGDLGLFDKSPNVASMTHIYKHMPDQAFKGLSSKLKHIKARFDSHRAAYIAKSGKQAYDWAREEFATVLQAHHVYSIMRKGTFDELFQAREKALAENVEWQVNHGGDGSKFILLSHNNHIAKSVILAAGPNRKTFQDKPLGMSLANAWPGRYVALGTSFYEGKGEWHVWQNNAEGELQAARPDSLDAVLAASGGDLFFVSMRDLIPDSPAGKWAAERHVIRSEGAIVALAPLKAYDGLLFVRRLSQAHFTRAAIDHLSATGPPRPPAFHVDKKLLLKTQGEYQVSANTDLVFKMDGKHLYVHWNRWKFRAFPVSNDRFELRVSPTLRFRVKRDSDGKVTEMDVQRGDQPWRKATIVE